MLQVNYATIRDVQRNYKRISEKVNNDDFSYVVMSNNKPQFVIVSMKTFSELKAPQGKSEELSLLSLIDWAEEQDFDLPSDLSEKHDAYLWGK